MIHEFFTSIGAVIALVYVSTITGIIWWMLHIPKAGDVGQQVARIRRETSRFARIVVPVQGDFVSDRLVALASQMARFRGARMDVLYVVEVPQQFPIEAVSRYCLLNGVDELGFLLGRSGEIEAYERHQI